LNRYSTLNLAAGKVPKAKPEAETQAGIFENRQAQESRFHNAVDGWETGC
jgi:hypothetical protein